MRGSSGVAAGLAAVVCLLAAAWRPWTGAAAEPNDAFDTATAIVFNTTFRDSVSAAGDVDYFAFTVGATPTQLTATLQELPANYDLQLYGPNRVLIASSSRGANLSESISYTATQTGTFYLRVYSPGGETSATQYAVRVDAVEPTPTVTPTRTRTPTPTSTPTGTPTATPTPPTDPYEPNDSYASAYRLMSGQTAQGRIHVTSDLDFFRVLVPNAGSTIQVTLSDLPADYDLYLDKPDQSPAASSTSTGTTAETVSYDASTTTGYFYVVVLSNRGGAAPATYTLQVTVTSPPGAPAVFSVDTLADEHDASVGDGACRTASGTCSLRAAVQESEALAGPQAIDLPPGRLTLTIGPSLRIADELRIYGVGPDATVIDATGPNRHFFLMATADLTLQDVQLTNGYGVVLYNQGTATLLRVTVTGNHDRWDGEVSPCCIPAVANVGTMSVEASRIVGNATQGIFNGGVLTLRASTVASNYPRGDTSTEEPARGGGIDNRGRAELVASTVSGNQSKGRSAGGVINSGVMTLTNSTVSGNTTRWTLPEYPTSDWGRDILNGGELTVTNSTLTVATYSSARVVAANSIVYCDRTRPELSGPVTSLGHNLGCPRDGPGDLGNVNADLQPLGDYGGPTLTHALGEASAAIDAGDGAYCPPTDQRGVARPQRGACDIGAFERRPNEPGAEPTPTATPVPSATPTASATPPPTATPAPAPSPGPNRLILPVVPEARPVS